MTTDAHNTDGQMDELIGEEGTPTRSLVLQVTDFHKETNV